MRTLLIDNYDSYTFNLFQLLAEVNGDDPIVVRNDQLALSTLTRLQFDNVVISPGPGHPARDRDFGVCRELLRTTTRPVLGVCLGHQGIADVYGGAVTRASRVMHGDRSAVGHTGRGLFAGIPQQFKVVRYHSLAVEEPLPKDLTVTARADDGTVMAVEHTRRPMWGVQFHPESVCTEHGRRLLENFTDLSRTFLDDHRIAEAQGAGTGDVSVVPNRVISSHAPGIGSLRVVSRRIPLFPDPEAVFETLFADSDAAYWLDSSRVGTSMGRFSFMGDADGPYAQVLRYRTDAGRLEVRTRTATRHIEETVFDYVAAQLAEHRIASPELPFDFNCGFVGYFGYELKAECGARRAHAAAEPDALLIFADRMVVFDHRDHAVFVLTLAPAASAEPSASWIDCVEACLKRISERSRAASDPPMPALQASFHLSRARERYLADIKACQDLLARGESYEICLTNRLHVDQRVESWDAYKALRAFNPAPYSAFVRAADVAVLSSSPERFLKLDRNRVLEAKPIKGTAPRGAAPDEDRRLQQGLGSGEKERAENLMIVDLLRNDLGLVCEAGSVTVPVLMNVETYHTVHQLVSTIRGRVRPGLTEVDCLKAAFPGGSMTGAPKLRTMEIIDELEGEARGAYSGALGFLALNGTLDLSIVIRTIVINGESTSIGVGGAITIQSEPEEEFEEIMLKGRAPLTALSAALSPGPARRRPGMGATTSGARSRPKAAAPGHG
jgi:para-aminobenzoate synthetase